jgi:CheY-like chemotaxis protein
MDEFVVTTASSAREGIARLAQQAFDLVITDLRMESPMAGFEVVAATRGLVPRPVTVLLTAFPVPTDEWQRVGADTLLVKRRRLPDPAETAETAVRREYTAGKKPPPMHSGSSLI